MSNNILIQSLKSVPDIINEAITHIENGCEPRWIPAQERTPKDGVRVVVKTNDGCVFFGSAYNGKLMSNVAAWYPLPE